jgi:hypothetical protein
MVLALLIVTTAFLAFPANSPADVLLIEEVRQAEGMTLPVNGISKDDVRAKFGDPAKMHPPVGDPPITRWDYDHWFVYFEYDLVLSSVLKKGQVLDKNKD